MNKEQSLAEATDQQLVQEALEGNQAAYTLLVQRHREPLWLFVNEFLGHLKNSDGIIELAEEPQDIVQEAFQKAF